MPLSPPRFGEVYEIGHSSVQDPVPHFVSSDLYNASGLGVLAAEVDNRALRTADIHERIPGVGTAMLDRISWYPSNWLGDRVGVLDTGRHDPVTRVIRNLLGNEPL